MALKDEQGRDLRERTKQYALGLIRLFASLPRDAVSQVLGRQALRSGTSVGANYREAFRARSKVEFVAKLGDCLKELDETAYWLELLREGAGLSGEKTARLEDETGQLLAILTTIAKKSKAQLE